MGATLLAARQVRGGTSAQTLRTNSGGVTVWDSFLVNSGTQVTVNSVVGGAGSTTVNPFQVKIAGNTLMPDGIEVVSPNATDLTAIALINSSSLAGLRFGLAGNADDYFTGVAAKDAVVIVQDNKRLWFALNAAPRMILDSTGLIVGATAAAGARIHAAAGSGMAALFDGVSGQISTRITAISASPALDITNTTGPAIYATSSVSMGTTSGAESYLNSNAAATAAAQRYGGYFFGKNIGGTVTSLGGISMTSEEDNTTNLGTRLRFTVGTLGAASRTTYSELRGNGQFCFNASGAEAAVSSTGVTILVPTRNGVPSGVPAFTYTGAMDMVVDRSHNCIFIYSGGWVTPKWRYVTDVFTTAIGATTKNMAALTDVQFMDCSATVGGCNLPDATTRGSAPLCVKNTGSGGGAGNCTVSRSGSDTIDGGTSVTLTPGQRAWFVAVGTDYKRVD